MPVDPVVRDTLLSNRYILGMSTFSLGVIFNITTFFALFTSGIIRQSTGFYLLFMMIADTLYLLCTVLMEEFYNPLILVDVFDKSGEGVLLCQVVYFFREMCYYWRWYLLAMMVIDRCLLVSGTVEAPRLRIFAVIMTLLGMALSSGLAGYWIYWVDNTLFPDGFVKNKCKFTLAPVGDNTSTWFIMEAIVHILYPDGILGLIILISAVFLLCRLNGKAAQSLEGDDFNLSKAIVGLAFVNLLIQIPYLAVNCIIKYVDKVWDAYDFSDTINTNLTYAAIITNKAKDFNFCITFWILIFARQFRSAFCKN